MSPPCSAIAGLIAVARPDAGPRLAAWRRDTQPLTFGERLSICFAWSEHDRDGLPGLVELGPGGFGSGEHPTTRLLIEELLERLDGGERVLDVGCGSGVLGLCALQLGGREVVAVDLKPEAIDATRRNAALNGVADRFHATLAPLSDLAGEFDAIVANVGRAAIVEVAPDLTRLLASGGWLGVSGISPAQCEQVGGFVRPLAEHCRRTDGEWASVVFVRTG